IRSAALTSLRLPLPVLRSVGQGLRVFRRPGRMRYFLFHELFRFHPVRLPFVSHFRRTAGTTVRAGFFLSFGPGAGSAVRPSKPFAPSCHPALPAGPFASSRGSVFRIAFPPLSVPLRPAQG